MSRNRRSQEGWFSLIERCEESGLGIQEFCQQEDICSSNYYYWRKRYRSCKEQKFVPLRITGSSIGANISGYEVVYPNGVTLRLGGQVGLGELSQLLRLF